ncbi:NAD(P)/FAD-dependent oxidoreductase [Mycobacterium sp. MYCO198283]|uniref:flavin-containing monooxygenase n=1 Tax=Mycobacterium sp. MYCO198283 TaxID=2883505 RepID=UPI001E56B860|nr:NAD(P)/FAD-dependent oxidoreductase [Mycobacterium sp. MYCO198283]MCG5432397.1 NAD(P)/FAD-dependent oxidoreductase [Mycobacterium sp. MYCO198283]
METFDVIIIGAGLSGIGAAYRITERTPGINYVILERRERIGGTWDLFRYPGVRSDSDIFSLSFPYEPWTRPETIADGEDIREYVTETARKHGIDRHIRFNRHVRSADWDSTTDTWTVTTEDGETFRGNFVFFGTGYYNYDEPYHPDFPGITDYEDAGGTVIHPQHWPQDLDYRDKRVVVIGSGATAMSLVPALAETAAKVTLLQRSPTYVAAQPRVRPQDVWIRKLLPRRLGHLIVRWYNALYTALTVHLSRKAPNLIKAWLRKMAVDALPEGYPVDVHFKPRYNPWDQRMCLIADGDLWEAISAGRVEMVTDHIDHMDATGIALRSGDHVDADIIVTATGLQLQALGGVAVSIDGAEIKPHDRFVFKAHLLEDVPNLAWCVGYTNASWTLRADMTARSVARLIAHMRAHGYTHAYPHRGGEVLTEKPAWDLQSGYVLRALDVLPKSGTRRPWNVRQNFVIDALDHRFDRIEESMVFGTAGVNRTPLSA